jgi:hypothetical protein
MLKTIQGTIRGRTIDLAEDPGLQDGQLVRVQVTRLPRRQSRGARACGGVRGRWRPNGPRKTTAFWRRFIGIGSAGPGRNSSHELPA